MTTSGPARPVFRLALYYGSLAAAVALLVTLLPGIRELFASGPLGGVGAGIEALRQSAAAGAAVADLGVLGQAALALLSMLGALLLMVPVAWVYMLTKRRSGYDQSVVQTMIVLPLVVCGVMFVVTSSQNALALAFALAAIVAAIRFRNTLKDTKDTVYVFLAIGVGLAAGVQALALAAIMSIVFNALILALWRFNVGGLYAPEEAARLEAYAAARASDKKKKRFNGAVLVHARDLERAQRAVETVLEEGTKRWKLAGIAPGDAGRSTLEYLVRLGDDAGAARVLDALRQAAAPHVEAVEFRSLKGLEPRES